MTAPKTLTLAEIEISACVPKDHFGCRDAALCAALDREAALEKQLRDTLLAIVEWDDRKMRHDNNGGYVDPYPTDMPSTSALRAIARAARGQQADEAGKSA